MYYTIIRDTRVRSYNIYNVCLEGESAKSNTTHFVFLTCALPTGNVQFYLPPNGLFNANLKLTFHLSYSTHGCFDRLLRLVLLLLATKERQYFPKLTSNQMLQEYHSITSNGNQCFTSYSLHNRFHHFSRAKSGTA